MGKKKVQTKAALGRGPKLAMDYAWSVEGRHWKNIDMHVKTPKVKHPMAEIDQRG
jgi:hypothetical protein